MIFSCPAKAFPPPVGYWSVLNFAYSRVIYPEYPTHLEFLITDEFSGAGVEMINPTVLSYENWQKEYGYVMENLSPSEWPEQCFSPYKQQNRILWNLTFDFDKLGSYVEPDEDGLYVFALTLKETIGISLRELLENVQIVVAPADPNKTWLSGEILEVDSLEMTIILRVPKPFS